MRREDFINWFEERFVLTKNDIYEFGQLYDEVTKPRWISVEDELPPRWETYPNVSVPVITFCTLGETSIPFVELQRYHFGDGRWLYGKATHWMPLPQAPHHFADVSQKVKKGGEK